MIKKKRINNPWGRAGKPKFSNDLFMKKVVEGSKKFLSSPFKGGRYDKISTR